MIENHLVSPTKQTLKFRRDVETQRKVENSSLPHDMLPRSEVFKLKIHFQSSQTLATIQRGPIYIKY